MILLGKIYKNFRKNIINLNKRSKNKRKSLIDYLAEYTVISIIKIYQKIKRKVKVSIQERNNQNQNIQVSKIVHHHHIVIQNIGIDKRIKR